MTQKSQSNNITEKLIASNLSDVAVNQSDNDVFISYSRRDQSFVKMLDATFRQINRDPWVDWNDIRKGEEWWKAIQRGIESAHTFIFVLSPDSVASAVCRDEIDYAAHCGKRFLPIVWREGFEMSRIHPSISSHNWLFFRETDDFDVAFAELLKAMDTDLEHVQSHTRLLVRSLEWEKKNKDNSYLLRGVDLKDAEQWLMRAAKKSPSPTKLHFEYISASQAEAEATQKARQRAKWIVIGTALLGNLLLVSGVFYWFYVYSTERALWRVKQAMEDTLEGAIAQIDGDQFAQLAQLARIPGQPEPLGLPFYQEHQDWLSRINALTPDAIPYSFTQGDRPNEIRYVGDLYRITRPNAAYPFGALITVDPAQKRLALGMMQKVIDTTIITDERGSWAFIAGPINNSAGQSVGALALDYKANYVLEVQDEIRQATAIACLIALIWLSLSSAIILRATRLR